VVGRDHQGRQGARLTHPAGSAARPGRRAGGREAGATKPDWTTHLENTASAPPVAAALLAATPLGVLGDETLARITLSFE